MKPSGAHTHPGKGGDGSVALVVLAFIIGLAVAEPIAHAVGSFMRVVVDALEVVVIVVASVVSVAVVAGLVYLVAGLRRRYAQQLSMLRSHQPVLAVHEPASGVSIQPSSLSALDGGHNRMGQHPAIAEPAADEAHALKP